MSNGCYFRHIKLNVLIKISSFILIALCVIKAIEGNWLKGWIPQITFLSWFALICRFVSIYHGIVMCEFSKGWLLRMYFGRRRAKVCTFRHLMQQFALRLRSGILTTDLWRSPFWPHHESIFLWIDSLILGLRKRLCTTIKFHNTSPMHCITSCSTWM